MSADQSTTLVEFREIPGFSGYRVGNDGSVWSRWTRWRCSDRWHRLKGWKTDCGYIAVDLKGDNFHCAKVIHRLVLEAFIGPCPEGMECCHNDGNPENNRLENLRWDTRLANIQDAIDHGTFIPSRARGKRNGAAKLTEKDIPLIRQLLREGINQQDIGRRFGVGQAQISCIKTGKTWSHVASE